MCGMQSQMDLHTQTLKAQRKAENYAKAAKRAHKNMQELAKAGLTLLERKGGLNFFVMKIEFEKIMRGNQNITKFN